MHCGRDATEKQTVHQELELKPPDSPVPKRLGAGCDQFFLEAVDIGMPPLPWPGALQNILCHAVQEGCSLTHRHAMLKNSPGDRHALTCSNMSHGLRRAQRPSDSPYTMEHVRHKDML